MIDITLTELQELAFSIKMPDNYSRYLISVLLRAEKCCSTLNDKIQNVKFQIGADGSIIPFGERFSITL